MYWGDPIFFTSMLLLVPGIILSLYAQFKVKSTYKEYSKKQAVSGVTGAQASRQLLDQAGLSDIAIEEIPGNLTDHYDPRGRVLRLSQGVARSNSLAALGVAAHETGHASHTLMNIGIVLFTAAVIFQIVTLPVEFDASSRAMQLLQSNGLVVQSEAQGARKVLTAAAMTYVAAALMSILSLVRMVLISRES